MQQWQQLTSQQKAIAGVLGGIIAVSLILLVYFLFAARPGPSPTPGAGTGQAGQQAIAEPVGGGPGQAAPSGPTPAMPGVGGLTLGGATPSVSTGPGVTLGMPTLGATAPGAPRAGAAGPGLPEAKPPVPGRADPFAPIEQPAAPPSPVVIASSGPLPPMPPPQIRSEPTETQLSVQLGGLPQLTPPPPRPSVFRIAAGPRSLEDPSLRLQGTMLSSDRVGAIIQMPDGRSQVVRPGTQVSLYGQSFTVSQITPDRVVLKGPAGEERIVVRRPTQAVPGGAGMAPAVPGGGPAGPGAMPFGTFPGRGGVSGL